jgi:hypothetical protein
MSRSSPLDWEDRRDGWNPRGKRRKQAGALASDWQHPELTRTNSPIVGGISVFPMPSPATEAVEKSRGRETGKGGRFSDSPAGAGAKPRCRRRRPRRRPRAAGGRRESRGMATTSRPRPRECGLVERARGILIWRCGVYIAVEILGADAGESPGNVRWEARLKLASAWEQRRKRNGLPPNGLDDAWLICLRGWKWDGVHTVPTLGVKARDGEKKYWRLGAWGWHLTWCRVNLYIYIQI